MLSEIDGRMQFVTLTAEDKTVHDLLLTVQRATGVAPSKQRLYWPGRRDERGAALELSSADLATRDVRSIGLVNGSCVELRLIPFRIKLHATVVSIVDGRTGMVLGSLQNIKHKMNDSSSGLSASILAMRLEMEHSRAMQSNVLLGNFAKTEEVFTEVSFVAENVSQFETIGRLKERWEAAMGTDRKDIILSYIPDGGTGSEDDFDKCVAMVDDDATLASYGIDGDVKVRVAFRMLRIGMRYMDGKHEILPVEAHRTISEVKWLFAHGKKGVNADEVRLLRSRRKDGARYDKELSEGSYTLAELRIQDGDELLVMTNDDLIHVHVKSTTLAEPMTFTMSRGDAVFKLKRMIEQVEGTEADSQLLVLPEQETVKLSGRVDGGEGDGDADSAAIGGGGGVHGDSNDGEGGDVGGGSKNNQNRKAVLVDKSVDVVLEEDLYSLGRYKVQHGRLVLSPHCDSHPYFLIFHLVFFAHSFSRTWAVLVLQCYSVIYMFMQEFAAIVGNDVEAERDDDDDDDHEYTMRAADANAKAMSDAGVHTDMKHVIRGTLKAAHKAPTGSYVHFRCHADLSLGMSTLHKMAKVNIFMEIYRFRSAKGPEVSKARRNATQWLHDDDGSEWEKVQQIDVVHDTLTPKFADFIANAFRICNAELERPILFRLMAWTKLAAVSEVGRVRCSFNVLLASLGSPIAVSLHREVKASKSAVKPQKGATQVKPIIQKISMGSLTFGGCLDAPCAAILPQTHFR